MQKLTAWQGVPEFDESTQTYAIQVSVPVLDPQDAKKAIGVLVVGLNLTRIATPSLLGVSTTEIAVAVEQQSKVTRQFADTFSTIQQANGRIAEQLQDMQSSAHSTSAGASSAQGASATLSSASTQLGQLVGNFST